MLNLAAVHGTLTSGSNPEKAMNKTMVAMHGGFWSPLDTKTHYPGETWDVPGHGSMTSAQFGNYLAGYAAGYGSGASGYVMVRAAGVYYAAEGARADGIEGYGESALDEASVPYINAGYAAGAAAAEESLGSVGLFLRSHFNIR